MRSEYLKPYSCSRQYVLQPLKAKRESLLFKVCRISLSLTPLCEKILEMQTANLLKFELDLSFLKKETKIQLE